jgi:alanine dehydrogenase
MFIVPERSIAELMTRADAFDAVEQVFAAMAAQNAYNFPVIREAIGHEDALYGFKGGFDQAGLTLGLKAGGYWPHNLEKRGLINHQSTVFLFDPDTGMPTAMVGGNLLTALRTAAASSVSIKHLARSDAKVLGMIGAGHQATFQLRAALEQRNFDKVIGWNYHPEMLPNIAKGRPRGWRRVSRGQPRGYAPSRCHHFHHIRLCPILDARSCQRRLSYCLYGNRHQGQARIGPSHSGRCPRIYR